MNNTDNGYKIVPAEIEGSFLWLDRSNLSKFKISNPSNSNSFVLRILLG
jgi:hypothetical protein